MPEFIHQRIRWGAKNSRYKDKKIFLIWSAAWLFHVLLIGFAVLFFRCDLPARLVFAGTLLLKGIMDFYLLKSVTSYFDKTNWLRQFLPAFIINLIYLTGIGVLLIFKRNYTWRGRAVR